MRELRSATMWSKASTKKANTTKFTTAPKNKMLVMTEQYAFNLPKNK